MCALSDVLDAIEGIGCVQTTPTAHNKTVEKRKSGGIGKSIIYTVCLNRFPFRNPLTKTVWSRWAADSNINDAYAKSYNNCLL